MLALLAVDEDVRDVAVDPGHERELTSRKRSSSSLSRCPSVVGADGADVLRSRRPRFRACALLVAAAATVRTSGVEK
jgi:hypothetical protein